MTDDNDSEPTFADIMSAAVNLSNASQTDALEVLNVWKNRSDVDSFIEKYQKYSDLQAGRGFMVPTDVSASLYREIEPQLNSLFVFGNFLIENFCPYFNLMDAYYDLVSDASNEYFKNKILADFPGLIINMGDVSQFLSAFAYGDAPCPKLDASETGTDPAAIQRYMCMYALTSFAPWGRNNTWTITFIDVQESLSPKADDSTDEDVSSAVDFDLDAFLDVDLDFGTDDSTDDATGDATVTYQDIVDAAKTLSTEVQGQDLAFIEDAFTAYSAQLPGLYILDFQSLTSTLTSCDNPSQDDLAQYPAVFAVNHVINGIAGFMNSYFYPYYNLILNNQHLLSVDALSWWNMTFNSSVWLNRFQEDATYSTSYVSLLDGLQQYVDLSGSCPYIAKDSPLSNQWYVAYSWFSQFYKPNGLWTSLVDVVEELSSADSTDGCKTNVCLLDATDADTSDTGITPQATVSGTPSSAYTAIASAATSVSTHAQDTDLTKMNRFAGLSIADFTGNFNYYNQHQTSVVYKSIEAVLGGIMAFGNYANNYLLPLSTEIASNPDAISTASQAWWKENFTDARLEADSTTSISVIDFATLMGDLIGPTGTVPETIVEGDDYWNALLVLYRFTPWDDTNSIFNALVNVSSKITPA